MISNQGPVLTHMAPQDIRPDGSATALNSHSSYLPRFFADTAVDHGKRPRSPDEDEKNSPTKRARADDPGSDVEGETGASEEEATSERARSQSVESLPNSQDIGFIPYSQWPTPAQPPRPPRTASQEAVAAAAEIYGWGQPAETSMEDEMDMDDDLHDSETEDDGEGGVPHEWSLETFREETRREKAKAAVSRAASDNCRSVRPEDDSDVSSFNVRPRIWRRPGPSPLGRSNSDKSRDILYCTTRKFHRIARDHGNRVDRVDGARVVLSARAQAW
ncbi:hypothetical protein OH77DRAFT_1077812 [Trametes cingulata]|nr:hypothetical protein OH77DRAFT_1077812 [Trametes cingulata]